MQQIIDGKRYDTATAEKIASVPASMPLEKPATNPPQATTTTESHGSSLLTSTVKMFYQGKSPGPGDLYRTQKGNWFVHEWASNQLIPVSTNEVKGWCEKFHLHDVLRNYLTAEIEEA